MTTVVEAWPPPLAIIILCFVLLAVSCRKWLRLPGPMWLYMLLGAIAVLVMRQLQWSEAWHAINFTVLGYLLGIFIIAAACEQSGYLGALTERLYRHCRTGFGLLLTTIWVLGLASTLLMNDTIAIMGAPVILQLCRLQPKLTLPLLLALAYAVTTASVLSPVGNPQNLLIALHGGLDSPFRGFALALVVPTLVNLVILTLVMLISYRQVINTPWSPPAKAVIKDHRTARCCRWSLIIFLLFMTIKIIGSLVGRTQWLNFAMIALLAAVPVILLSRQRLAVLRGVDWGTLVFFMALFVLVQSVWSSGYLQEQLKYLHEVVAHIPFVLAASVLLSQLISNVPLVALYLPVLHHLGAQPEAYYALAAGSTIAGNLLIFGAASNIIILHNLEKRGYDGFKLTRFIALGLPLTLLQVIVYSFWLNYLPI